MERLIYISKARVRGLDEVRAILDVAKRNNARDGLTGMLWWQGDFFVQALEGSSVALNALMAKLKQDPRHTNFRILGRRKIETPMFGKWNMGLISTIEDEAEFVAECLGHADLSANSLTVTDMERLLDHLVTKFPPNMDRILSS